MNARFRSILGALVALGVTALAAAPAGAETATLELKRLDSSANSGFLFDLSGEFLVRMTYPQHFFMQLGPSSSADEHTKAQRAQFDRLVKKQPAKYQSEHPFRGVAKLGSDEYAFVLDTAGEKSKGYDRLYFDLNHNGDLTDDKVIEAEQVMGMENMVQAHFPRVDLKVNVDGTQVDYAFFLRLYAHQSDDFAYVSASLNAAAYREGTITLDGRQRRVLLVDFNSNGRFDDEVQIDEQETGAEESLTPGFGDILMVDPDPKQIARRFSFDVSPGTGRHYVSKLVALDGRFYHLKTTPAGDQLTLTASTTPLGQVTNPAESFVAIVYGDQGFVQIHGTKDQPALLPEGEWKLLSYTIEVPKTETSQKKDKKDARPEAKKDEKTEKTEAKEEKTSLLGAIGKALLGTGDSDDEEILLEVEPEAPTYVSAQATAAYEPVRVTAGKTVTLPFGPPYKPVVKAHFYDEDRKQAQLELSLVGSAGEICSDMTIRGSRPKAPEFTIKTRDGKEVAQGKFRYG